MQIHAQRRDKRVAHARTERKYADNYNKRHNKITFKLQSA